LASAGATNLLLVTLLIPITAVTLGALLLAERLATGQLLGMLLILAGLVVIDGRLIARLRRQALVEAS
jgi:drug/metabolite transporter (DMT)-like permease